MNHEKQQSPFRNIAFYSSGPQQGKSESANYLASEHKYRVLSFATPINQMVESLLDGYGIPHKDVVYYMRHAKEDVIPGIGVSYRHLARTLGTEWGRQLVGDSIWINAFIARFLKKKDQPTCVDDLRFRNELSCLKEHGFLLVKITRNTDRMGLRDTHQSDVDLCDFGDWDFVLENNGTLNDLYKTLTELVKS